MFRMFFFVWGYHKFTKLGAIGSLRSENMCLQLLMNVQHGERFGQVVPNESAAIVAAQVGVLRQLILKIQL